MDHKDFGFIKQATSGSNEFNNRQVNDPLGKQRVASCVVAEKKETLNLSTTMPPKTLSCSSS